LNLGFFFFSGLSGLEIWRFLVGLDPIADIFVG
jgi:hypothetical protein